MDFQLLNAWKELNGLFWRVQTRAGAFVGGFGHFFDRRGQTAILAITENRGEGFDAVQRAPHAKSIRLPCDRCRSRSDTNRSQEQINASHPGPQQIHTAARTPCMRTSLVRTKTFVLSLMSVTRPPPFPPRSPKRPGRAGARAAGTVLDKSIPQVFNGL